MNEMTQPMAQIGWKLENSYMDLPTHCYSLTKPAPIESPYLILKNEKLAQDVGLSFEGESDADLAQLFCGNKLPDETKPIAQAYAGHQFGNFTMLGDGRAHLMGEHITPTGQRIDIQFKGSGRTPFSRRGDGKAAIGPMLREYIISEAMHALRIPTTRSLAVVATGEPVFREAVLPGAILTRTAASHIRVGTFQYFVVKQDHVGLKQLADYAIQRHYPHLVQDDQPYLAFLGAVMERQVDLIVNWMRVGFIHGVMNTDNMTISGETIDYGPCAFMDSYNPKTVFSSIDTISRYAFSNQAPIAQWNLARFAETLLPLIHEDQETAIKEAERLIKSCHTIYQDAWLSMMRKKIGLFGEEKEDKELIDQLLNWMHRHEQDYTNTFRHLAAILENKEGESLPEAYQTDEFQTWRTTWDKRRTQNCPAQEAAVDLMKATNPVLIPRNHKVEEALKAAEEDGELNLVHELLEVLENPYAENDQAGDYQQPAPASDRAYQTFCGT